MKESAGKQTGWIVDWPLLLGDLAVGTWLWFAFWRFIGDTDLLWGRILAPAAFSATLAAALGLHRHGSRGYITAVKLAALGFVAFLLALCAGRLGWLRLTGMQSLWLGAAAPARFWILRSLFWRERGGFRERAEEMARWIAIGLAATLVMAPFYFAGSLGAGDAHWYAEMLADFLAQLKEGVFPVWVGQSPFAFNGAVSPLRFAPAFQYYGAAMEFLTAQALQITSLKNLCLAVSALGGGYSAYACMRPITGSRRWIACLLAILWVAGPGVLAPVMSGDQYMTFICIPFVPIALHGCWRLAAHDDVWSRIWISFGLASLWICHPPIALWMTFLCGFIYMAFLLARHSWRAEVRRISLMALVFLAFGSLPFVSVLTLDNQLQVRSAGGAAAYEVHRYFPDNFKPINPGASGLIDYQLGYSLLGLLALSILLALATRQRIAWAFAAAAVAVIPFTVPVPFLTDYLWLHLPGWFVTIDNVWPMQRLFLVWSSFTAFFAAVVLGSPRVSGSGTRYVFVVAVLAGGLAWTSREARNLGAKTARARSSPEQARVMEGLNNSQLGRYPYGSFASTPAYASHGYMDGWFENRLLDPKSLEPFLTNADAAAPGNGPGIGYSELKSKGPLTAENISQSNYYFLRPDLTLDPGRRYAMRIEFREPILEGTLELTAPTMFREYLLPDSGSGIGHSGPPKAFGSLPTSGRVVPLSVIGTGTEPVKALLIVSRPTHDNFIAGQYWLYEYDRNRLPIRIESWTPYRVQLDSPRPAYLETPRMWLRDWSATVNGEPTASEKSPQDLVMVPVPAGPSTVTLEYSPPFVLRASFWIFLVSWAAAGVAAFVWLVTGSRPREARA